MFLCAKLLLLLIGTIRVTESVDIVAETVKWLQHGESVFQSGPYRDSILIFGKQDEGKHMLFNILTGQGEQMENKKIMPYSTKLKKKPEGRVLEGIYVVPQLYVDYELILQCYDFQTYTNHINEVEEMNSKYFINKVLHESERFKIVFTLNYGSFESFDAYRREIYDMVGFINSYMHGFDTVKNSVSLIVTNVTDMASDDSIKQIIKQKLQDLIDNNIQDTLNVKFVENLLGIDSKTKIRFVRDYMNTQQDLIKVRDDLVFFLKVKVEFANVIDGKWFITMTENSKAHTVKIGQIIGNEKNYYYGKIVNMSMKAYEKKILNSENEYIALDFVKHTIQDFLNTIYPHNFQIKDIDNFVSMMNNMGANFTKHDVYQYLNYRSQYNFFYNLEIASLKTPDFEKYWYDLLKNEFTYFEALVKLSNECSQHSAQVFFKTVDRSFVHTDEFYKKLKTVTSMNESEYQLLFSNSSIKSNSHLRKSIDKKVFYPTTYSQIDDTYTITSTFVFLADAISKAMTTNAKNIVIMASDTVFIDKNVNMLSTITNNYQIFVYANTWHIVGNINYNLNGKNGEEHKTSKASTGSHGLPGNPGASAGNFHGLAVRATGLGTLNVAVNGGAGGNGQDGGDGVSGSIGSNPYVENWKVREVFWHCNFNDEYNKLKRMQKNDVTVEKVFTFNRDIMFSLLSGGKGSNGGNGGDGGVSGHGGNKGRVKMYSLSDDANFITSTETKGPTGRYGEGGKGGKQGSEGKQMSAKLYVERGWRTYCIMQGNTRAESKTLNLGNVGSCNKNNNGIKSPNNNNPNDMVFLSNIINYKMLLVNHYLRNEIPNVQIISTLDKISSASSIFSMYTIVELANELKLLSSLSTRYDTTKLLEVYTVFKSMVVNYIKEKIKPNNFDDRKVGNYLLATVLGRMSYLSRGIQTSLVIDVESLLNNLKKNIGELNELKEQITTIENVNKIRKEYKANIDGHINNCRDLIVNMEVAIEQLLETNSKDMDKLVDEVIKYQNQALENIEEMEKEIENVKAEYRIRKILGVYKIFGSAVSVFSKVGGAITDVVDIVESMIPNTKLSGGLKPPTNIKDGFSESLDLINTNFMNLINTDKNDITEIVEINIVKFQGDISDSSMLFVEESRKFLNAIPNEDTNKFMTTYAELKENYLIKLGEINTIAQAELANSPAKRLDSVTSLIDGISSTKDIISSSVGLANTYKEEKEKLAVLNDCIADNKKELDKLYKFERDIYDKLIPVMLSLRKEIYNLLNTDSSVIKSTGVLDVLAFSISSTMKDIMFTMKTFTEEFEIQGSILHTLDKLKDALNTVTQVFARIQAYNEQKDLADYLADIVSPSAKYMTIENKELSKVVRDLDFTLRSNLIFEEYKRGADSFKQFVFPFGSLFLEEIEPFNNLVFTNASIEYLVDTTKKSIDTMLNNYYQYKLSIVKGHDEFITTRLFSSDYFSSDPFYTWDQNNKYEFSDLLNGKPTLFKSSITPDNTKNSIKFNIVKLRVKSNNPFIQSFLDQELTRKFDVSLTHMGNSKFRCGNYLYTFNSESQHIRYSFETVNGEPISTNEVYKKMKKGNLMLSPYAVWKIQLRNNTNVNFATLHRYHTYIYLELEGSGKYITQEADVCNHDQGKYYERDDFI